MLSYRSSPALAYGAGKSGVVSLTESLAVLWAKKGVRVVGVAPGWTETPFINHSPRYVRSHRGLHAQGRMLQAEEIER